ncbi:MAG: hypothetical protein ABEI97_04925 [Candidatus Nanohaloarchaea archaeon]
MDVREAAAEHWPVLLLLAATLGLFAAKDMLSFLLLDTPAGRDLAGNYAFTWLMKQNLLHGDVLAWSNHWLLGFPSFATYPPLFFLVTAALDIVSGSTVSLLTWFNLVAFLSVVLLPLTVYMSFVRVLGRMKAVFAGGFTLYFLFVYPPVSQTYQVMSVGLVAQGFAFLLVLPAIGLLFTPGRTARVAAGVLLGLTVLAHPFIGLVGGVVAGIYAAVTRDREVAGAAALAGAIAAPWLLNAARYLPYLSTYTFDTAQIGLSLLMLIPLAVLGGYRTDEERTLLAAFLLILVAGTVELPLVAQEFRFFTYALGLGSVLAGIGSYRVDTHLQGGVPRAPLLLLLFVPVIGLSLQADTVASWDGGGDIAPVIDELDGREPGRVLVETDNTSIHDAYTLQAFIPMETQHRAVNELHLDASTSANYILTLESWVSKRPLNNPLCRTCDTAARPGLIDRRLDDLGVRYVVTRTPGGADIAGAALRPVGQAGGFQVFKNTAGADLVEPLTVEPVAVTGDYDMWTAVNDQLFTANVSVPLVWRPERPENPDRFSAVVEMSASSPAAVVEQIREADLDPVRAADIGYEVDRTAVHLSANQSVPVRVKVGWSPRHTATGDLYASNFNTLTVFPRGNTTIHLR